MWAMLGMAAIFTVACIFFFIAGMVSGTTRGIVLATQFYREKRALKDKSNIIGFANWPEAMRNLFEGKTIEEK